MRIRSILPLAASAVAVVALSTPAQAVDNGYYLIQNAESSQCLNAGGGVFGGELGECGRSSAWRAINLPNGAVQFREGNDGSRCLALSPLKIYPPAVTESECNASPDQWLIHGPSSGEGVALSLDGAANLGTLTAQDDRARLGGQGGREWVLVRVG
ncbi:hypothetical protein ACFVH0_06505 [Streptomyces sp. NPDC127117]|uniref:hypothetical protein n=1 Tax=Streptomyces sp. NPDC127117 TaxID=3345368 RepID=UPI003632AD88